jgi:hypothetical protein
MTSRTNRKPVGFYSGRFFYELALNVEADTNVPCRSYLRVDVQTHLTDRLIEIGRDIDRSSCQFRKAEQHYRLKAKADETVFVRYSSKIADRLRDFVIPQINDGRLAAEGFDHSGAIRISITPVPYRRAPESAPERTS